MTPILGCSRFLGDPLETLWAWPTTPCSMSDTQCPPIRPLEVNVHPSSLLQLRSCLRPSGDPQVTTLPSNPGVTPCRPGVPRLTFLLRETVASGRNGAGAAAGWVRVLVLAAGGQCAGGEGAGAGEEHVAGQARLQAGGVGKAGLPPPTAQALVRQRPLKTLLWRLLPRQGRTWAQSGPGHGHCPQECLPVLTSVVLTHPASIFAPFLVKAPPFPPRDSSTTTHSPLGSGGSTPPSSSRKGREGGGPSWTSEGRPLLGTLGTERCWREPSESPQGAPA